MTYRASSAAACGIDDTALAVIDLETTGLARRGEILEIAVVRIEPGAPPQTVLNTLVRPDGPVKATRVHGILDDEVLDAPLLAEVLPHVQQALAGCVTAAYNAAFDIGFLRAAGTDCGWPSLTELPHVCLMWLRQHLGLGRRQPLDEACAAHGIALPQHHSAASDAQAAAALWTTYRSALDAAGVHRFGDLSRIVNRSCSYVASLDASLPTPPTTPPTSTLRPRTPRQGRMSEDEACSRYARLLAVLAADGRIAPPEANSLVHFATHARMTARDLERLHDELLTGLARGEMIDHALSAAELADLGNMLASVWRGERWVLHDGEWIVW